MLVVAEEKNSTENMSVVVEKNNKNVAVRSLQRKCVQRNVDAGSMWGQCVVDVGWIRVVVGVGKNINKRGEGGGMGKCKK